jgi:hypothetical protein
LKTASVAEAIADPAETQRTHCIKKANPFFAGLAWVGFFVQLLIRPLVPLPEQPPD